MIITLLILGWISLVFGLFLPVVTMSKKFLGFTIDNNTWSILSGIWELLNTNHIFIGLIIFVFSVIFPLIKITLLSIIWTGKVGQGTGKLLIKVLSLASKWSMLDVFVVAVLVVICKLSSVADAEARYGIYVFGLHVITTMVVSLMINNRLSNKKET